MDELSVGFTMWVSKQDNQLGWGEQVGDQGIFKRALYGSHSSFQADFIPIKDTRSHSPRR